MQTLNTGDIFLFEFKRTPGLMGFIECCIRCFTDSRYSHAAFVWVDPVIPQEDILTSPQKYSDSSYEIKYTALENGYVQLKGPYIWDSAKHEIQGEDGKIHFGVQLTSLKDYIKKWGFTKNGSHMNIYKRSPINKECYTQFKLKDKKDKFGHSISRMTWLYNNYRREPYDMNCCDWCCACLRCRCLPRKDDALFCSAFVAMILTYCDVLPADTDWKIISPGELSSNLSWCVHWLRWKRDYGYDKLWEYGDYIQKHPKDIQLSFIPVGHPKNT